mmetsp:Transcript_11585/g.31687  ORF Transcript_11585/g.31687 Transcript_11585/m.31687 type:complete len:242 (-) Transcript_11585:3634-4359(-)
MGYGLRRSWAQLRVSSVPRRLGRARPAPWSEAAAPAHEDRPEEVNWRAHGEAPRGHPGENRHLVDCLVPVQLAVQRFAISAWGFGSPGHVSRADKPGWRGATAQEPLERAVREQESHGAPVLVVRLRLQQGHPALADGLRKVPPDLDVYIVQVEQWQDVGLRELLRSRCHSLSYDLEQLLELLHCVLHLVPVGLLPGLEAPEQQVQRDAIDLPHVDARDVLLPARALGPDAVVGRQPPGFR